MRLALVSAAAGVLLAGCGSGDGVRSDLSARDQELCGIALDREEPIGYLSHEIDELLDNGGRFSSESAVYAFITVPVDRSHQQLRSRIPNHDEPDSAGYIDDPELLDSARVLSGALFDLKLSAGGGGPVSTASLRVARRAIDGMVAVCTA